MSKVDVHSNKRIQLKTGNKGYLQTALLRYIINDIGRKAKGDFVEHKGVKQNSSNFLDNLKISFQK